MKKNISKKHLLASLLVLTLVVNPLYAQGDASSYISEKAFGWGTCSDVNGTPYVLDGGERAENPKTIVLTASGGDDYQAIINAIKANDIIYLDGSKGDFIVSKQMDIRGVSNKSIIGINGARLCTKWYVTPELKQQLIDANLDQYTTASGTGGTLSNGASVNEQRELKTRQLIIDITGDDSEAYRKSGFFAINSSNENIIFRNLIFQGPGSVDVGGADLISNNGATHVWIDHCEFIDGLDGNLDSGKREGSEQFVTYSWNIFRYTERSYSHPYSNGVGWSKGYLQYITYAYNIWGNGCEYRLPVADWVYIHILNNYYNCPGNSQAIGINDNSHALIEGNYVVEGVNNACVFGNSSDIFYLNRNNYGFQNYGDATNTEQNMEVPYQYPYIDVMQVPEVLTGKYGAGATIDDLVQPKKEPMTAKDSDYSKRMILSQGEAWSAQKSWDYVSGLVTKSILKATTQYPQDDWSLTAYDWCKYYADAALNSDGSFKNFKKGNIDNIASGKVFFELYDRELSKGTAQGDANAAKYKAAAEYLYNYLRYEYSRIDLEDGKGGFYHKDVYPYQMWLDGLYMGAAFYAEYLHHFAPDDAEGWSDVANQFITIHRHTYDSEVQLNYHGWSAKPSDANSFWAKTSGDYVGCSSEFWGRGMGWYFAALTDVLELMPATHENFSELRNILCQVAAGLQRWQDPVSGVWYQLLRYDDSYKGTCGQKNYLEASASCMFAYSYLKALRLGLIDETYRETAERAYKGALETFITENADASLNINQSCRSAGLGPAYNRQRDGSASYYLCGSDVTIVSNEGKAIGPFIMASLEWELLQATNPSTPSEPSEPSEPGDSSEVPENAVYFWQSVDGAPVEKGGVASGYGASEGRVNYANADYHTISINAKKANIETDYVLISLDEALQAADQLKITAYRNKDTDANGTLYILFENGHAIDEGEEVLWNNVALGQQPNTNTYSVGQGEGSRSIKFSRSKAGTNLFITKLLILRQTSDGLESIEICPDNVIYNIFGQKINKPIESLSKGLYIINGQKVLIR